MRQFGSFFFFFSNNNNIKEEEEQEPRKVSFTAAAAVGRRVEKIPRRVLTPDEFAQKLRRKK